MKLPLGYRLIEPGGKLHPIESIPIYACAFWFATLAGTGGWSDILIGLATTNAVRQLILFVVVVQIPAYVTGHMSNVDVAWPTGLVLMAIQGLQYRSRVINDASQDGDQDGGYDRAYLMCLAFSLHGGRMAIGAIIKFFPYDWPNGDLSRYQYAKKRWVEETGAEKIWWLKQQHDTIMQAYFNSVFLAVPIFLVCSNPNPSPLRPMEIIGFRCWLSSWMLENVSDIQMLLFVERLKKTSDATTAVIGYPPYNEWSCWMWTLCRHPNYFFEWVCWNSFLLMAIPSALDLMQLESVPLLSKAGLVVVFFYTSRMFYDCLLYWTGSEPAESRSVKRRPLYKRYQEITNVFFPFYVPFINHHRTPGWPVEHEELRS